ncbi:unnamed protein product [Trifolium pratense]|uniref:Uncharacterized protein n=1 Tax=Trifolium pratense TaxID=57577 RepID=A0ACB0M494_TRIPR|nr:unnamed protein product [Trifolium pratense]
MCSEISSPRFYFSNDVSTMKNSRETLLLESNPDFEFITSTSIEFETSSADELFSNGVILPLQIQDNKKNITTSYKEQSPPYTNLRPPRPFSTKTKKENIIREVQETNNTETSSFWGSKRSRSLNCETNKIFVSSSTPLPRSHSTGSAPNLKRTSSNRQQSSYSTLNNLYPMQKSSSGKSYGNGFRISPVLNVPTNCFSKGGLSFFGFGSFLRVGKAKKKMNN